MGAAFVTWQRARTSFLVSLGALSLVTGCDVRDDSAVRSMLLAVSAWNDHVQQFIFRPTHLAPTFSEAQVVKPPRFNAYYDIEDVKPVNRATWRLELGGRIADKRPWRAEQFDELPQQELIIRHICVDGWDYIGQWSGVNFRTFLERVGADLSAKYVAFRCADDYTESLDMPTALHPQILATRYAKEPITDPFGFPLRLRTATKLGFKNPCYWSRDLRSEISFGIPRGWSPRKHRRQGTEGVLLRGSLAQECFRARGRAQGCGRVVE